MLNSREVALRHIELPEADVYIYAVKDDALREVVEAVRTQPRTIHVHTSGTMPVTVFGEDKPNCGIMYPFQTFSKLQPIDDFSSIPLFIEARGIDNISAIYTLALTLSPNVYEAEQHERERLHVAGVFANNFSNAMYSMAAEVLRGTSIPFKVLLPLIDQTAAKVHTLSPEQAQSGPAARDDEQVIEHHLELLKGFDFPEATYRLLTDYIRCMRL